MLSTHTLPLVTFVNLNHLLIMVSIYLYLRSNRDERLILSSHRKYKSKTTTQYARILQAGTDRNQRRDYQPAICLPTINVMRQPRKLC